MNHEEMLQTEQQIKLNQALQTMIAYYSKTPSLGDAELRAYSHLFGVLSVIASAEAAEVVSNYIATNYGNDAQ